MSLIVTITATMYMDLHENYSAVVIVTYSKDKVYASAPSLYTTI